jgi:O-antigen ligase
LAILALLFAVLLAGPFGYWIGHGAILGCWTVLTFLVVLRLWASCRDEWLQWLFRHLRAVLFVLAVALASPLWSLDPAWSLYRATWVIQTTLLGLFIGYRCTPRQMVTVLFWVFAIILVASALSAVLLPAYGLDGSVANAFWVGVMPSRAGLGFVAGSAAAFLLIGVLYRRLPPTLAWPLFALALFVLLMSRSGTGIIVVAAALLLIVILWLARLIKISALAAMLLMIISPLVVLVMIVELDTVAGFVGRDATLTNRTEIWADAVEIIKEQPLIGFGLNAVWGHETETWFPYLQTTTWAAHAHNGYLMLATDLGLPVALVATVHLIRMLFLSLEVYISTRSPVALFNLVYLFAFMLGNLSEPRLYQARRLEWILAVAIMVNLLREFAPSKPRAAGRRLRAPA